jgi:hypothetical protein
MELAGKKPCTPLTMEPYFIVFPSSHSLTCWSALHAGSPNRMPCDSVSSAHALDAEVEQLSIGRCTSSRSGSPHHCCANMVQGQDCSNPEKRCCTSDDHCKGAAGVKCDIATGRCKSTVSTDDVSPSCCHPCQSRELQHAFVWGEAEWCVMG